MLNRRCPVFFCAFFGTCLKDFNRNPQIFQKNYFGIGTHRGATFLGCFRQNLSLKALYMDKIAVQKHKILIFGRRILGTPVGGRFLF